MGGQPMETYSVNRNISCLFPLFRLQAECAKKQGSQFDSQAILLKTTFQRSAEPTLWPQDIRTTQTVSSVKCQEARKA